MLVLPAATGAATMGGAGGVKTRLVKIGASNAGHAPHNRLVTAKFTLLNFLPLALFAQFRRVANLYFLLNGMLMMFAEVTGAFNSPYTSYTTLGPLMFLITISLINDALTDIQRHRADMRMDATAVDVVSRGGGQLRLANIRSGDVLRCVRGEVGVGISGLEGRQAVNASDFAIGQFRFLHRLLFIHGRWAYRRSSALILFSFYKNAVLAYCLFFYSFNTGFSGTSMFHEHYTSMYNFYLATQIFWLACFDRDVDEAYALNHPRLYDSGRLNLDLRVREVVTWQFSGLLHAVLIYYLVQESLQLGSGTSPYDTSAHMVFGTVGMVCITVAMNLKVLMETRTIVHLRSAMVAEPRGWLSPLGFVCSHKFVFGFNLGFFYLATIMAAMPSMCETVTMVDQMPYWGVGEETLYQGPPWLTILLVLGTWLVVDWLHRALRWEFGSDAVSLLVERCHLERWARNPQEAPWGADLIHLRKDSKIAPA